MIKLLNWTTLINIYFKDFVFLCLNRVIGNNVKSNKIGFKYVSDP